jgi:aminomethyltransferase
MCYPDGGVVDDLLIYKLGSEDYLLVVNAPNTDKDFQWMLENRNNDVNILNVSDSYAQLAIQGPNAQGILQKLARQPLDEIRFYHFNPKAELDGMEALISRSGYTGEDGFEIYVRPNEVQKLWDTLLEAGKEDGLVPAGLGARDTLRFEAALPLYGQEISENISPLEAGLGKFVKLDKEEFIGKPALARQKEEGIPRKLVGFEMVDRGVPRSHYEVYANGAKIGHVTTGSYSPSLKKNIGLALLDGSYSETGTGVEVVVRNRNLKAVIVETPFYKKKYKK